MPTENLAPEGTQEELVNQPGTGEAAPEVRTPVSLKDDDLVEITVDGRAELVPYKEAKSGFMRHADYTRKTQSAAQERQKLSYLYEQVTSKQREVSEKEAAIDMILGRTPQGQSKELPEDEVLTYGQLKSILSDFQTQQTKQFNSTVNQTREELENTRTYERFDALTKDTVATLTKEYPALQDIPHLDAILKREARRANPTSESDMVKAILNEGKLMAERLDKRYEDRQKEKLVKKRQLTERGPEPRGGGAQFNTGKKTYGSGRTINWNEIEQDVIAAIDGIED